jgi:hypothetical protein
MELDNSIFYLRQLIQKFSITSAESITGAILKSCPM